MSAPRWYALTAAGAASDLAVDPATGLSAAQAGERLARDGPNLLVEAARRSPFRLFIQQFSDLMVLVLIGAAVVAGALGEPQDTIAIIAIVVLNAILGFTQDYRAERALAALKALAAPQALVRRDGVVRLIPSADLVVGDVVRLETGNIIPADLRLIDVTHLRVDESAITGESNPVDKIVARLEDAELASGERTNLAWKGTTVVYGRGDGLVVATGMGTELGRIAGLLSEEEPVRTPLQRRLDQFARAISVGVLALCAVIFGIGLLRGEPPALMFLTSLSLAVAAIPEALPAVVTVSLALGARRMAARRALIRHLPAVETLGSVTCICSDKTGTLTANRSRLERFTGNGERLLPALALNNDVRVHPDGSRAGDPTEIALLEGAEAAGYHREELAARWPRVAEIPFSSHRGRMTTIHRTDRGFLAFTKGAPEQVVACCAEVETSDGAVPIDAAAVVAEAERMASEGMRVLAVAFRPLEVLPESPSAEVIEKDMCLLGLVGLLDPPRPEAPDAVSRCATAGIRVVLITGDHPATARAIATALGILEPGGAVLTGVDVARLEAGGLDEVVARTRVFARVAPEQKLDIVKVLQLRGDAVAMTGDGVNDAPALHRADIGVAMGLSGTDVAREAADMVLLDDNFATIVAAVEEGRRIFDNIRKFIRYVLTGNSGEIWTLFLAPFLGLPVPLLPIHILWVNLVTDGLPGLALAVEPAEPDVMRRPPRPPTESLFAGGLWQHVVWVGLLIGGVTLAAQALGYHDGSPHWQSMTFTVLTFSQLFHVLAIRSERVPLWRQGLGSNLPLLAAVLLTVGLQLATLYVPAARLIFRTQPLTGEELALCVALSSLVLVAVEVEKWVRRRR